jgi:hypothetical protein
MGILDKIFGKKHELNARSTYDTSEALQGINKYTEKLKWAEKIINDYGQAIEDATAYNKSKADEFFKNPNKDMASTQSSKKYLQGKLDIKFLPYDKKTIEEALNIFINNETNHQIIEQLKAGHKLLDEFVDYSTLE